MWVDLTQSVEGLTRTKNFNFFTRIPLGWPLNRYIGFSPAFTIKWKWQLFWGLQPAGLSLPLPVLVPRPSGSEWNYAIGSLGLQLAGYRSQVLLASIRTWANFLKISLSLSPSILSIYRYIRNKANHVLIFIEYKIKHGTFFYTFAYK